MPQRGGSCGPRGSRGSRGQDGLAASRLRPRMFTGAGPRGSADLGCSTGILHKGPGAAAGSRGRGTGSRSGAWAKGLRSRGGQGEGWPGRGRGRKQRRRGAESILPGEFAGGPLSPRKRLAGLETAGMERREPERRVGLSPASCPQARLYRAVVPGAEAAPPAGVTSASQVPHLAVPLPWCSHGPPKPCGGAAQGHTRAVGAGGTPATSCRGQEPSLLSKSARRGRAITALSPGGRSLQQPYAAWG